VVGNEAAFLAAGFEIRGKKQRSLMRVATHPMLPGHVFKVFFIAPAGQHSAYQRRSVCLHRYRAFAPEARRAIAGINHGVKFLSYFAPQLNIRGVNIHDGSQRRFTFSGVAP